MSILGGMVLFDIMIMSIWAINDPIKVVDVYAKECFSEHSGVYFSILVGWKALMLCFGVYLAYTIRRLPDL